MEANPQLSEEVIEKRIIACLAAALEAEDEYIYDKCIKYACLYFEML